MNKHEIYDHLRGLGIEFRVAEHAAVFDMSEIDAADIPDRQLIAKNLFLRDDLKRNYYLLTLKGGARADLKGIRKQCGTRRLSFAGDEELFDILSLRPGCVSPLGLLNDEERRVIFLIDADLAMPESVIGIHPADNTATVFLKTSDLLSVVKKHGNEVGVVRI